MNIPQISLNKDSTTPLYRQLSAALQELINQGKLAPDAKLPSIRQLARALDVNTTTVVSTYKLLEQELWVYSIIGSGTFVAPIVRKPEMPVIPTHNENYINFAETVTDAALFPVTAFKRAFEAVLDRDGGEAFKFGDSLGLKPLRESLSILLENANADNIQVIAEAQQGLETVAKELLSPGDTVFVEGYTTGLAVGAFFSRGARVIEMPMNIDGPDFIAVEAMGKKYKPKLIYVMPNFQTPTGITYSEESKIHLLELAQSTGAYILEDDQLSDLYYDGKKRTPLKALDAAGRVIYIKSFARTVMPGIGFMVFPEGFAKVETTVSGYIQRGFDLFLRSGAYELHLANLRSVYGRRYQKLEAAAKTYLSHLADFQMPGGGLSLWITPRNNNIDYINGFLQRGVVVSPGRLFSKDGAGFRISFAGVKEEKIAEGIGIIAAVLGGE
ncbi:MAG: PLP-dependent aminotransferase family protein [Defluviitaleaceae bacterium]|nr:PLP-dependent aminotransferase family protein [Defluviitaleaceae bacterium]